MDKEKSNGLSRIQRQSLQKSLEKIDFVRLSENAQNIDWNSLCEYVFAKQVRVMGLKPRHKSKFNRVK